MKVERQEKNKQQRRDTDDAGEGARLRSQIMEHGKNLAQRICRCQLTAVKWPGASNNQRRGTHPFRVGSPNGAGHSQSIQ